MNFRQIDKMLRKDGWYCIGTSKSSHFQYKHPIKNGKVTVPKHKGDIDIKTLNSIFKQAGLK